MADDLRARLEAALEPHTRNGCLVDVALVDVVDAAVAAVNDVLRDLVSICCHQVYPVTHTMACRNYAGPIDHWRVYASPDVLDLAARGLIECTCGERYSTLEGCCPNVAEAWRGPRLDGVT